MEQILRRSIAISPSKMKSYQLCSKHWVSHAVKFCSIQSHQSNPAKCAIQSISNIIIHYITKYGNFWCIVSNMATFCLNFFPINHLQNLSSYEIVYGHKPPAITDLQLEGDDLTRPTFYHFFD